MTFNPRRTNDDTRSARIGKNVFSGAGTANEVFYQVVEAWASLSIDRESNLRLSVPDDAWAALAKTNLFGVTAQAMLEQCFPSMTIDRVPGAEDSARLSQA